MTKSTDDLAAAARTAAAGAYAPYSNFRVGAVVVGSEGEEFAGANVENAAYPATSCADHSRMSAGTAISATPPGRSTRRISAAAS